MVKLHAVIAPNSREFAVDFDPALRVLKVKLTEKAEKGKANLELVKKLSKLFGAQVFILSGLSSKKKLLQVELDEGEVARRVSAGKQG